MVAARFFPNFLHFVSYTMTFFKNVAELLPQQEDTLIAGTLNGNNIELFHKSGERPENFGAQAARKLVQGKDSIVFLLKDVPRTVVLIAVTARGINIFAAKESGEVNAALVIQTLWLKTQILALAVHAQKLLAKGNYREGGSLRVTFQDVSTVDNVLSLCWLLNRARYTDKTLKRNNLTKDKTPTLRGSVLDLVSRLSSGSMNCESLLEKLSTFKGLPLLNIPSSAFLEDGAITAKAFSVIFKKKAGELFVPPGTEKDLPEGYIPTLQPKSLDKYVKYTELAKGSEGNDSLEASLHWLRSIGNAEFHCLTTDACGLVTESNPTTSIANSDAQDGSPSSPIGKLSAEECVDMGHDSTLMAERFKKDFHSKDDLLDFFLLSFGNWSTSQLEENLTQFKFFKRNNLKRVAEIDADESSSDSDEDEAFEDARAFEEMREVAENAESPSSEKPTSAKRIKI